MKRSVSFQGASGPKDEPELEATLTDMVRIMAKVAARDFSERPAIADLGDRDDELAQFLIGFRFMMEDLEKAHQELERDRAQLTDANDKLREMDRAKTRLINSAAHELGTPLTPIKIQLHMLKQMINAPDPERLRRAVDLVDRNVERLSTLVRDMLDVARLGSGRFQLSKEPTDIVACIVDAVESFSGAAQEAGIEVALDVPETLPAVVDGTRIVQVLFNLLSNALKFTPRGGRVMVVARRRANRIEVRVTDTGPGIAPADLAKLFQAFSQLQDPARAARGAGLGLFISRGLVEAHGGRMWCESPGLGQGSTFAFDVPVAKEKSGATGTH